MTLVERDAELARLVELVGGTQLGRGGVAVVSGPATTGKTALLTRFAERVADDAVVLTATGSIAERDLPLGVLGQLSHHVEVSAEQRSGLLAHLDDEGPLDARSMVEACGVFLDLAARRSVLVVVDDVQHADVPSVQCLLYLLRRVQASRMVLAFADSGHAHVRHPLLGSECARQSRCVRLPLTTLSVDGVRRLARERFGASIAEETVVRVHGITGGNPLLTNAVLDDLESTGEPGEALAHAVGDCLHRGEPVALEVARGLAVLGAQATPDRLGKLLELAPAPLAHSLDELTTTGLLADCRFRHEAVRSAVLRELTAAVSGELHARAARLLHEDGASSWIVAEHLLSTSRPTERWAAPVLQSAADHAIAGRDTEAAARYLDLAHHCGGDDTRRAAIKAAITDLAWRSNPAAAQPHLTDLVSAVDSGVLPGRQAIALVRRLLWHGRYDEALESLRTWENSGEDADLATAVEQQITRLALTSTYPPLLSRTRQSTVRPVNPAGSLGVAPTDPRLQAASVLGSVLARGATPDAVALAEQVLQRSRLREDEPEALESTVLALQSMLYAEKLDVAGPWCDRLLTERGVRTTPTWHAQLTAVRAEISLRMGDLPRARASAEEAMEILPVAGWGVGLGLPRATLIAACTRMGAHREAAEQVKARVPEAMLQTRYGLHYLHARGHHHLATEQHFAALADFLACGELMRTWGVDQPSLVPWRTSAAQAWLQLGNTDQARKLINEQLTRLGPGLTRTRGIALRQLAAVSDRTQRVTVLTDAMKILDVCGDRFELASALADLGRAQHALGAHSRARMMARRAWHLAQECQAEPLAREVLPSGADDLATDRMPEDSGGITSLSVAEHRVGALAAQGYSNRDISGKLFITVSTVEQHLTKVYKKLGVKHRKDLPRSLYAETA